jgi:hypothetical protein
MAHFKHYDECIAIYDQILERESRDEAGWFLKCRVQTLKCWIYDLEINKSVIANNLDEAGMNANTRQDSSSTQSK